MKKLITLLAVGALSSLVSAADIDAGKAKSATCVACHGANGISVVPIYPNLAGQKEQYLVASLKAYRAQERKGGNAAVMYSMAGPLSDTDIENLAAYFASLDPSGK